MLILSNLDLAQNELQNFVLHPVAVFPSSPAPYQCVTLSTDNLIYQNIGTRAAPVWRAVGSVLSVNGKTGVVLLTQDDVGDGEDYVRTHNDLTDTLKGQIGTNQTDIAAIQGKIPAAASTTNQLADKTFVTDSISQSTAFFRGSFATKAALLAVEWQTTNPEAAHYVTNNDYAVVLDDETQNDETWRYIYVTGTGWTAQYRLNESPLTTAQLAALNSGITAALVEQIGTNQTAISGIKDGTNINSFSAAEAAITAAGSKTTTGTIGTSDTSASVQYTGTLLGYYAVMGGSEVLVDVAVGSGAVTFSVAAPPSAPITCTVIYR